MVKTKDFEKSLKELEDIVKKLETGELTLEESFDFFQKGVDLSKVCSKILDDTEQKVNILIKNEEEEIVQEVFDLNVEAWNAV